MYSTSLSNTFLPQVNNAVINNHLAIVHPPVHLTTIHTVNQPDVIQHPLTSSNTIQHINTNNNEIEILNKQEVDLVKEKLPDSASNSRGSSDEIVVSNLYILSSSRNSKCNLQFISP